MPASARTNRRTKRLVRDVHCQLLDRVLVNIVNIVYFTLFGVRYCPLMTSTVSLSPFWKHRQNTSCLLLSRSTINPFRGSCCIQVKNSICVRYPVNIQYSPASFFTLPCVISPIYQGISTLLCTGAVSVPTDSIVLSDSSVAVLGEVFRLSGLG